MRTYIVRSMYVSNKQKLRPYFNVSFSSCPYLDYNIVSNVLQRNNVLASFLWYDFYEWTCANSDVDIGPTFLYENFT